MVTRVAVPAYTLATTSEAILQFDKTSLTRAIERILKAMQIDANLGIIYFHHASRQWTLMKSSFPTRVGVLDHTEAEAIKEYMRRGWKIPCTHQWDDIPPIEPHQEFRIWSKS